jgi:lipoprotein NlpI
MRGMSNVRSISIVAALLMTFLLTACTPTVMLDTSEPITINLNVNIKHEILVRVDKQLDDLFSDDSDIF